MHAKGAALQTELARGAVMRDELAGRWRAAQQAADVKAYEAERWKERATTKRLAKMSTHCVLSLAV